MNKVADILSEVNMRVDVASKGAVGERVIATLTEREVQARTDAFLVVLTKLDDARKAARKIKPDGETFAVDGEGNPDTKPTLTYSKAKIEERKKNHEEQKRLEDALNKALEGDFAKVKELAAKGGAKPASEE